MERSIPSLLNAPWRIGCNGHSFNSRFPQRVPVNVLITNDDGINAPGITALADAFDEIANVTVIAPEYEQSGISHALTFLRPLFARQIQGVDDQDESDEAPGVQRIAINGTPSDCTKIGIVEFCDPQPDLVISGINGGLNVGINCLYSGTLAGAREGAFFGIPSFAVSLEVLRKGVSNPAHLASAANLSRKMILQILEHDHLPGSYHNINFPIKAFQQDPEITVVPMEKQRYEYRFEKGIDPTGRPFYWTKHTSKHSNDGPDSDVKSIEKGLVTITPMTYDLTDQQLMSETEKHLGQLLNA